jgi:ABC-2 type transport system ATP-binding protein
MTGTASAVAFECFGLGKRYRRSPPALTDCTLRLPAGSICALVGPNGAGKSRCLHWLRA